MECRESGKELFRWQIMGRWILFLVRSSTKSGSITNINDEPTLSVTTDAR